MRGVLTKVGDTFDRLTGRNWKPSSSLATSELIEKLKSLLDSEAKVQDDGATLVPHYIKLKMQWDKFSTDSEKSVEILRNQLHISAIDHINDNRYYTAAPFEIEVKPDYFTDGVKLSASFDKFQDEEHDAAINVSVPKLVIPIAQDEPVPAAEPELESFSIAFNIGGKEYRRDLKFAQGERKSIGRTKENDVMLDDASISKVHAAFVFNSAGKLVVADIGSTNGTFINGNRIAYGRAFEVRAGDLIRFGTVEVKLESNAKAVTSESIDQEIMPEEPESAAELKSSLVSEESEPGDSESLWGESNSDSLDFTPEKLGGIPETRETQPGILLEFENDEKI